MIYPNGPGGGLRYFSPAVRYASDPFKFFEDTRDRFAPISHHRVLGMHIYLLYAHEGIEQILIKNPKNYQKDPFLRSWRRVFGDGLLTAEGDLWKREHRMIQPAFRKERVESFGAIIVEEADALVQRWCSPLDLSVRLDGLDPSARSISVLPEMMKLTLQVVVRTLFGTVIGGQIDSVEKAFVGTGRYFEVTSRVLGHLFRNIPSQLRARYRKSVALLDQVIAELVQARVKAGNLEGANDLLASLLLLRDDDGSRLTQKQLRDELLTLFLAGHETTALTLTYALYLLARHPHVQSRARLEFEQYLQGRAPGPGDLEHLPYLKSVVQEALRLYPPAWVLARQSIGPDTVQGYPIPPGATLVIPTWAIHRDPKRFESPNEFRPERFTPELMRALPRTSFLPFGAGPRMCIGSHFAMMEAALVLIQILSRFELTEARPDQLELQASITLRPQSRVEIRVRPTN